MKPNFKRVSLFLLMFVLLLPVGIFAEEAEVVSEITTVQSNSEQVEETDNVKDFEFRNVGESETDSASEENSEVVKTAEAVEEETKEIKPEEEKKESEIALEAKSEETEIKEEKTEATEEKTEAAEEKTEVTEEKKEAEENKEVNTEEVEGTENVEENEFKFSTITDVHVLPSELIGDGTNPDYKKAVDSDRKLFTESLGLLEEAVNIIEKNGTKYLFITGDLTKDGEHLGHEKLAEVLQTWKDREDGRKVFVVPGNHDINNHNAFDFSGENTVEAKRTNPEEFMEIYGNLTYKDNSIIGLYKDSPIYKAYLDTINAAFDREEKYKKYAQGYTSFTARVTNNNNEKDGVTLIGLDTAIYTADSTSDKKDGHQETNGRITTSLMKWVVGEVEKANKRNDVVMLMSHHAFVPHFNKQEEFLSPYIIREWKDKLEDSDERINGKTPSEILVDMGVKYIFTGHLHAHDTAKYVSPKGKEFFDIQTGSTVTYPLPVRHINIKNNISSENPGFTLDMNTDLIEKFTFINPETGEKVTVDDALKYSSGNQLTPELVSNIATGYLGGYLENFNSKKFIIGIIKDEFSMEIPEKGYGEMLIPLVGKLLGPEGKVINTGNAMVEKIVIKVDDIKNTEAYGEGKKIAINVSAFRSENELLMRGEKIEESIDALLAQVDEKVVTKENINNWLTRIVNKIMEMPVSESENPEEVKTLLDLVNDSYRSYLKGDEVQPEYIKTFVEKYKKPGSDLVNDAFAYATPTINEVFEEVTRIIEYRLPKDKDNTTSFHGIFVRNLLEREGTGKWEETIIGMLPSITGENIDDTLGNSMIVDAVYGKDSGKNKVAIMDILAKFGGTKIVSDALNSFAPKLGGTNLTEIAVDAVDGMTNEFTPNYKFAFQPDGKGSFKFIVAPSNKDNVKIDFEESGLAVENSTEGYNVKEIELVVNDEVIKVESVDKLEATLAELKGKLVDGDNVKINFYAENEIGNTFIFTDSVDVKIKPVEPTPVEPTPVDPVPEIKPVPTMEFNPETSEVLVQEYGILTLSKNIAKKGEKIVVFVKNLKAKTSYNIYLKGYGKIGVIVTDENGLGSMEVEIPEVVGNLSISVTDKFDNYIDLEEILVVSEANI